MTAEADMVRAGFWRRMIAFCLDFILVTLVLQILAMGLYSATGGRVQSGAIIFSRQCHWPPPAPGISFPYGELEIPHGTNISEQKMCRLSALDLPYAHYLEVTSIAKYGSVTITNKLKILLDSSGKAVWVLWLDAILLPLLFLYRMLLESRLGYTLGKRVTRIEVVGEKGAPSLAQSFKRNLYFLVPAFSAQMLSEGSLLATPSSLWLSNTALITLGLTAIVGCIWFVIAAIKAAQKSDTIFDRLAGTSVVRTNVQA